jgi:hypothetical protein
MAGRTHFGCGLLTRQQIGYIYHSVAMYIKAVSGGAVAVRGHGGQHPNVETGDVVLVAIFGYGVVQLCPT